MSAWKRTALWATVIVLTGPLLGCVDLTSFLNPDFLAVLGSGSEISGVPGEAPGVLVQIENRTTRWARAVVSYRDGDSNTRTYNTVIAPGDLTGQMLVCPVEEITLGSVADLDEPGAIIYLTDLSGDGALDSPDVPFIEVDAFGVLLREEVNYSCGDGLKFSIRETPGQTRSGYRVRAEITEGS